MQDRAAQLFRDLQSSYCDALESIDGEGVFQEERWDRADISGSWGGGGVSRLLKPGRIFEQAGVNFSLVHGVLPSEMVNKLIGEQEEREFLATGVSLVIHPHSPHIPTIHLNFRYLEVSSKAWFGGGIDLTPYVFHPEDFGHFHSTLKKACDQWDPACYERYKRWCDEYFYLPHRQEARGVGGIFFDYRGRDNDEDLETSFDFVKGVSSYFLESYLPIISRQRLTPFSEKMKRFQLLRRGRYVEFNLLYDRGTLFGLKTGGRVASVFMSMPPEAQWAPVEGYPSDCADSALLEVLSTPRSWIEEGGSTLSCKE
jgi:coproporphyrinogen III oxidase